MPLSNLKDIFDDLLEKDPSPWAVGHFNVQSLGFATAIIATAESLCSPVILGVSPKLDARFGLEVIGAALIQAARRATVPVCVHLDHASSPDLVARALEIGFLSIMFDGSSLPLAENIAQTRQIRAATLRKGASLEGEVGLVPPPGAGVHAALPTDPDQAVNFAEATGVDALAVSVGSAHGMRQAEARLDMGLIRELARRLPCPLVLHGASGVVDADIRQAIEHGIRKVNISTELKEAFLNGVRATLADSQASYIDSMEAGTTAVKDMVAKNMALFRAFQL